jgi:6-pyruvoyltetrahydropterin/6-carboxytetrahydropterin synthase
MTKPKPVRYAVGLSRAFVAHHRLIGADFGPENALHAHDYRLEVACHGPALGPHAFLLDITELTHAVETLLARVAGTTLNDVPELTGQNPSLEAVATFFAHDLAARLDCRGLHALTVKLWENDDAWASVDLALTLDAL